MYISIKHHHNILTDEGQENILSMPWPFLLMCMAPGTARQAFVSVNTRGSAKKDVKLGQKHSCSADSPQQAVQASLMSISSEMVTAESFEGRIITHRGTRSEDMQFIEIL